MARKKTVIAAGNKPEDGSGTTVQTTGLIKQPETLGDKLDHIIKVKRGRNKDWETDRGRRISVLERKIENTEAHVKRCPNDKFGHMRLAKLRDKLHAL